MKIVHICLNAYIDGWGYQENMITQYQKKKGYEVEIIASATHFPKYLTDEEIKAIKNRGKEYVYNGIKTYRINTSIHTTGLTVRNPKLYRTIRKCNPDIIFHHDVTIPSLLKIVTYKIFHPNTTIVVDNHIDNTNKSRYALWNFLYLSLFTRLFLKVIEPSVRLFYGVTPGRCDFLINNLGIPQKKVKLLPIGCDTDIVNSISCNIEELRRKYALPLKGKIIISGGKMGMGKGTINLIKSVVKLKEAGHDVSLVLFGKFLDNETKMMANESNDVYTFGWCDRITTIELLKLSDVACWPLLHTTLIEDAVACAIPLVLFKSENTIHTVKNNGILIEKCDEMEIYNSLTDILFKERYNEYKQSAEQIRGYFSYNSIAEAVVEDCNIYAKNKCESEKIKSDRT